LQRAGEGLVRGAGMAGEGGGEGTSGGEGKRLGHAAEIEQDQEGVVSVRAAVGHHAALADRDRREITLDEGGLGAAQSDQLPVEGEQRGWVAGLLFDIARGVAGVEREPGLASGEAGLGRGIPLHGRAAAIAAGVDRPVALADRVEDVLAPDLDIAHADLLTVVEEGRAAQREQQGGHDLEALVVLALAVAGGGADDIMVVEDIVGPLFAERLLPGEDAAHEGLGVIAGFGDLEIEAGVQAVGTGVFGRLFGRGEESLANGVGGVVTIQHIADILQDADQLGLVEVIEVALEVEGADAAQGEGVIAEALVLEIDVEDIQAEAAHALIEPEAEHIQHLLAHFGVAPVEVGLFLVEHVVVVLAGGFVPLPAGTAKDRLPVVGRAAAGGGVAPEVVVAQGVIARGA